MKHITNIDDLVPYTKLYLVDTKHDAVIVWWSQEDQNFQSARLIVEFWDCNYIVELCDEN
ncbi:MAG: hypothetical protein [Caudoviricetes sp.]|nr:MAG: hypothetical protein [Caudoviricetes sp.]